MSAFERVLGEYVGVCGEAYTGAGVNGRVADRIDAGGPAAGPSNTRGRQLPSSSSRWIGLGGEYVRPIQCQ